jgi:prolyl oligopeptidase
MPKVMEPAPGSPVLAVTEVFHGIPVIDPYRWLEDQSSAQTRAWLEAQAEYARAYLNAIPGRQRIHQRIRELLDVEIYDSVQKVRQRYFFRKRLRG